jgi:hypothetical protein
MIGAGRVARANDVMTLPRTAVALALFGCETAFPRATL